MKRSLYAKIQMRQESYIAWINSHLAKPAWTSIMIFNLICFSWKIENEKCFFGNIIKDYTEKTQLWEIFLE